MICLYGIPDELAGIANYCLAKNNRFCENLEKIGICKLHRLEQKPKNILIINPLVKCPNCGNLVSQPENDTITLLREPNIPPTPYEGEERKHETTPLKWRRVSEVISWLKQFPPQARLSIEKYEGIPETLLVVNTSDNKKFCLEFLSEN